MLDFTHAEVGRHQYRLSWRRPERLYDPRDPVTTYHIYGTPGCRTTWYIHPYKPSDRDRVKFSIIVNWAFVNNVGDEVVPTFGMTAENSAGIGVCQESTQE